MVRLNLISFFLCLLMTLQMLPTAQIGMILSTNQWTEELPHSSGDACQCEVSGPVYPFLLQLTNHHISTFAESMALAYIHTSARIPSNHSNDVVKPPPDRA